MNSANISQGVAPARRGITRRITVALLWFATLASINAFGANAMEAGRAAYAAGDYSTAIEKWLALVQEGRPEGSFFLGVMYAEGKGVERNHVKAFDLYNEAAQKGYVPAQYNLGNQYATGEGVAQDYAKAEFWWTKAAEAGLAQAQVNLGTLYLYGVTGAKDYARARKWLTLAAVQGSPHAKDALAKLDAESPAAPAPAGVASAAQPPTAAGAQTPRREAWVLAQPAAHHTIQILAAGSEAIARDYIKQHDLAAQAAYVEGAAPNGTVFRVIYGSYANRDQADKALAALPRALSGTSPWVRSFSEVHKLIDRRYAERGGL